MSEEVPSDKLTKCSHAICADCTKELQKAECPICRANLEGGYLTQDNTQAIIKKQEQNTYVLSLIDRARSDYSSMYPDRLDMNDPNVEIEGVAFSDAFGKFIENNPQMTIGDVDRIFQAFVEFTYLEQQKEPLTVNDAINEFQIIGYQMLDNKNVTFDDIYATFYHELH